MVVRDPGSKKHTKRGSQNLTRPIFPHEFFFRVSLNGLGERGTTHRLDLHVQHILVKLVLFTKFSVVNNWNHCFCMLLVKKFICWMDHPDMHKDVVTGHDQ